MQHFLVTVEVSYDFMVIAADAEAAAERVNALVELDLTSAAPIAANGVDMIGANRKDTQVSYMEVQRAPDDRTTS